MKKRETKKQKEITKEKEHRFLPWELNTVLFF